MTIDRRDGTTHRKTHENSPNEVRQDRVGTIPSTGNSSKEPKYMPSQKPAPGQSY